MCGDPAGLPIPQPRPRSPTLLKASEIAIDYYKSLMMSVIVMHMHYNMMENRSSSIRFLISRKFFTTTPRLYKSDFFFPPLRESGI